MNPVYYKISSNNWQTEYCSTIERYTHKEYVYVFSVTVVILRNVYMQDCNFSIYAHLILVRFLLIHLFTAT